MLGGNNLNNTDFDTLLKNNTHFIVHFLFGNYEVRVVSVFPRKDDEDNFVELVNAKMRTDLSLCTTLITVAKERIFSIQRIKIDVI